MKTTTADTAAEPGPLDHDYINRNYIQLGCADVLKDVIDIFMESYPEKIIMLKKALENMATPELTKASHGLKGEAGSVGAMIVNRLAAATEQAARREDIDEVRRLIPELEKELARASEALKRDYQA